MRIDEEYAKNSIKNYLKNKQGFVGDIVKGEDPPDYYVLAGDTKIAALEITTAESIYRGEGKNRKTLEESLARFCDEINDELESSVPVEKTMFLIFNLPVLRYDAFKKGLLLELRRILQGGEKINKKLYIEREEIELRWVERNSCNHKAIIGMIGVKDPIINIQEQTQLIMKKIIEDKKEKMEKIVWKGEKWLGVINNYILAEGSNFLAALREMKIEHSFSKIFIIENNTGNVVVVES